MSVRLDSLRPGVASIAPPAIAVALVAVAGVLRWRGFDLPAQIYRVELFHLEGLTLWDSQWYGGHWTLNYSLLFPPVAGTLGIHLTEALSAGVASVAFDRMAVRRFGRSGRLGAIAFAVGTLVQVGIGQVPFLLGEAAALAAFWAATRAPERRGRWALAAALAAVSSLASPEAGAFLAVAIGAWLLSCPPADRVPLAAVAAGAVVPVVASALVFPGQGTMPFPFTDFLAEGVVFTLAALAVPHRDRVMRRAALLYLAVFVGCFVLPSPAGGNIERFGETLGVPLAVCLLWPARRLLLVAVALPIAVMQWGPVLSSLTANHGNPSGQRSYFEPMLRYVEAHDDPPGRIEIVPTALHWEAAYAAPVVPLARGWERQLDTADNRIFYTPGALTAATYLTWLTDNGVRFVALPDVKLDYAAVAEGALVRAGVPGLRLVWDNAHWKVYAVAGSAGLVTGSGRLVRLSGGEIDLDVVAAGTIEVRERYSPKWAIVEGDACTHEDPGGWLGLDALQPGPVRVAIRLVGPPGDPC